MYDDLFPKERHPDYVQTEWGTGWVGVEMGFGYAAEHLTENRRKFGATIDQVGVVVFFLQRHRVEIALKTLLAHLRVPIPTHHDLMGLWGECETALGHSPDWKRFSQRHRALVAALARADQTSMVFRYPVDKKGEPVERPPFIDLDVLNERVGGFSAEVNGYIDYLSEMEALEREAHSDYGP